MPDRRTDTIAKILAASRRPVPTIVERRKLRGSDGKWYTAGSMPSGVSHTGEVSDPYYLVWSGCSTVGTPATSKQAIIDRHNSREDANADEFRAIMEGASAEYLANQAEFWIK